MKKIILFIALTIFLLFFIFQTNNRKEYKIEDSFQTNSVNKLDYFVDNDLGVNIILVKEVKSIELLQNSELLDTFEVFKNKEYGVVFNGGYFDQNKNHAGLLNIFGEEIVPLSQADKQVTQVVQINRDSLNFLNKNQYINLKDKEDSIFFQTGPKILDKNIILHNEIENSINGNGSYKRTLIGKTSQNEIFVVATKKPYSLKEISEIIIKKTIFSGKELSVVNLDGGYSVSLVSEENDLNIGINKRLPFLIGIKI